MAATREQSQQQRVYGGLTGEERRERRRAQLIEAGIELFGTVGVQGTSIRAVVRESGLIERYFYESFANLDELFAAVYDRIRREIYDAVMIGVAEAGQDQAEQIRAGVRAFIVIVTRDPRYARIKLVEEAGIKYKIAARPSGEAPDTMVDYIAAHAPPSKTFDAKAVAVGLVGAMHEILTRWYHGELDLTEEQLVEQCAALFANVARLYLDSTV